MLKKVQHLSQILPKHYRIIDSSGHRMAHLTHPKETAENVKIQHVKPQNFADWLALYSIWWLITMVNIMSGFVFKPLTESKWILRALLLQTIAPLPGLIQSIAMHFRSIFLMTRDKGWIHHQLEQSDNQRFHFLTFVNLKRPGLFLRIFIIFQQITFCSWFFIAYLISPRFCHKYVGYMEEQAFKNYTDMLREIDREKSVLSHWKQIPASKDAIDYYQFDQSATLRDVILAIRADEVFHQESNHFFGEVDRSFDLEEEKVRIYHDKNDSKRKMGD